MGSTTSAREAREVHVETGQNMEEVTRGILTHKGC